MSIRIRIQMTARAPDEPHRVSSALELLFDLTFVIAIAALTGNFAHAIGEGHAADTLVPFLQVFFAIWWAWSNFTWFASAFDTDDVPFRLATLVQMAGVLVLAAGVPAALDHGDYAAVALGYVIMRLGLVAQWLRAAAQDPPSRAMALRYAFGITVMQIAWVLWLVFDDAGRPAFFAALALAELAVPLWAERRQPSNWHPHHIAERHGLFTIILLGEGVFAASTGVQRALSTGGLSAPLVTISAGGLVLVFALWWLYFLLPAGDGLARRRERSYLWGYGHYGLFAALALIGAGLEIAVEQTGHHLEATPTELAYAIAIPVAAFLTLLWALHSAILARPPLRPGVALSASVVILALPLLAESLPLSAVVAAIAAVCAAVVALTTVVSQRAGASIEEELVEEWVAEPLEVS